MSLSLAFRFPAGRYHATPFGHHVNEGMIEWPPSPWRLLRALISVGYTSDAWGASGPPPTARKAIKKLSADLPSYFLPSAVGTHSRHYMPIGKIENGLEKTTLVFDTWARVEDKELIIIWPNVDLDDAELSVIDFLVGRMNYLGRSESWVEGRVVGVDETTSQPNCFPDLHASAPDRNWQQITLLAPVSPSDYHTWRMVQLESALADLPLPKKGKPSKTLCQKRDRTREPYPRNLLDCLQKDTNWLRSHRWNLPPGSQWVSYWRSDDALKVGRPKVAQASSRIPRIEASLLSLTNASRNDHALPPVTRTLPQAELLHRKIIGIAERKGTLPSELAGRDESLRPLQGPHEHIHINPLDLNGDGHLDHILVWAPGGFGADAQTAIRSVRETPTKGDIEPLRLALAIMGNINDLTQAQGTIGQHLGRIVGSASTWHSLTPFVPPRYLKRSGKNTLEGQIRAELRSRGFPEPIAINQLPPNNQSRFRHFNLVRRRGPEPPRTLGFDICLEFETPVSGPIAIGYGSHFGLGLFG